MNAIERTQEEALVEFCGSINLNLPCDCVQPHGWREQMFADEDCTVCGGTGRPSVATVIAAVDHLNSEIDQLTATAAGICTPAKLYLDLAWWQTEHAIRKVTGHCSMHCKSGKYCSCCQHYNELTPRAERAGRLL